MTGHDLPYFFLSYPHYFPIFVAQFKTDEKNKNC